MKRWKQFVEEEKKKKRKKKNGRDFLLALNGLTKILQTKSIPLLNDDKNHHLLFSFSFILNLLSLHLSFTLVCILVA